MRHSKFNDEMKRSILDEYTKGKSTVQQICQVYGISANTFYLWKRTIEGELKIDGMIREKGLDDENQIQVENKTLRKMYINLSAQNYELAKFLEK